MNYKRDREQQNLEDWSGLTRDEIESKWPGWVEDGRRPEGWEHDDVLAARVTGALQLVVNEFSGSRLLVVCHGGVILRFEEQLGVRGGRIPNLTGRIVTHNGTTFVPGGRLELLPTEMITGGEQTKRI